MAINQIYDLLAKRLENDINKYSEITKFTVKTSYNYQEPSEDLSTINGVMNFANSDIAPIEDLDAYTLPAVVSFVCLKEYANEVMAILTAYIKDEKGKVQDIGEYYSLSTFSTPSQSDVIMAGQIGESIKVTVYIEYLVLKNILVSNDMTVKIDGETLVYDRFGITKAKSSDEDNIENNETLQSVPLSQGLAFMFNCFVPVSLLSTLVDETLSLGKLQTEHTLTLTIKSFTYEYKVIMSNSEMSGVKGGAMYASFTFSIADGKNGGKK